MEDEKKGIDSSSVNGEDLKDSPKMGRIVTEIEQDLKDMFQMVLIMDKKTMKEIVTFLIKDYTEQRLEDLRSIKIEN